VIVDRVEPIISKEPQERQRLYSVASAARILGWTETALRAAIFRERVRVVNIGRRVFVSVDELDRLTGR
jgi:hypothetical protein